MSIPCPVPYTGHKDIPEGADQVETLENVVHHLSTQDRAYLEQKCKDLLGILGVLDPTKI